MTVHASDILEVTVNGVFDATEDVENVYQFMYTESGDLPDANVLEDLVQLIVALYGNFTDAFSVLYSFPTISVKNVTQDILLGDISTIENNVGLNGGTPLPSGVCLLVTFRTAVSHVVLRKYLGVFTEANNTTGGTWDSAIVTDGVGFGGALMGDAVMEFGTYRYGTLSTKTDGWILPQSFAVYTEAAYQRRRRRGVGS